MQLAWRWFTGLGFEHEIPHLHVIEKAPRTVSGIEVSSRSCLSRWLGHSDMESIMRYLKPSRSQKVRDKVNGIFA
jgi:hypothetical protein